MQQCQDQLQFQIETPDDQELARRFADRQKELTDRLSELVEDGGFGEFRAPPKQAAPKNRHPQIRSRKSKQTKRQERNDRPVYKKAPTPELTDGE